MTATLFAAATATPTTPAAPACIGDCNRDRRVAINELIQAVSIALGNANLSSCVAADANQDGALAINELVRAVSSALLGYA